MNPSTHPKCFFSGASSITKSEPTGKPAGPRDLAFDEFRIGEKTVRHELINYRKPAPVKHFCCFQSGVTWCSRRSHRVTRTIRNGERGAKFFAVREALAGCRGAALTRRFCGAAACGGATKHILSLRLGSKTIFDELAITTSNRLALLRKKSRNRRRGVRFEISAY